MSDLDLNEGDSGDKLFTILTQITFESSFFKRIQALEVVFSMLEQEIADQVNVKKFKKFLQEFTDDKEFMRKAMLISNIDENVETALEFYGQDYISTPDFHFDEEFMTNRREIDKEINKFVGELMKESNKEDDYLDI